MAAVKLRGIFGVPDGKMKLIQIFLVLAIFLISGCVGQQKPLEKITIKAEDGTFLKANFFDSENPKANIVLLHMYNRNKNDWNEFAKDLQRKNYAVLAIDFRGHGESSGELKTQLDFSKMVLDVKAANFFLSEEHANKSAIVIGASIGANVGLQFAAKGGVDKLVLLSPDMDYKGIQTKEFIEVYNGTLLIAAAKEDVNAFISANELFQRAATPAGKRELIIVDSASHGTNLLEDEGFKLKLLDWLESN